MTDELKAKLEKAKCPTHGEMFVNDCDTCFCALALARDAFAHAYIVTQKELDLHSAEARRTYTVRIQQGSGYDIRTFISALMDIDLGARMVRFTEHPLQNETFVRLDDVLLIESNRE